MEEEKTLPARVQESPTAFSGAVGKATDHRSFQKNRELAFKRLVESKTFKSWHKLETSRRLGKLIEIEKIVDEQMNEKNLKIEYLEKI